MDLTRLKEARDKAGHNLAMAEAKTLVSTTTLASVENGHIPKSAFIKTAIAAYIKKYLPEPVPKKKK